jgi:ABC-2 type transport system permease protein
MASLVRLLLAQLARDRWTSPIWILGIAGLALAAASAVATEFADEGDRMAIIAVASINPAFLFLRGTPDGSGIGAVVFFQAFSFLAVLAGLMSTFLVVRHTRADEELGRAELITSTPVRRAAPLAATIVLGTVANAVLALLATAGFIAGGLAPRGAAVAGLAVGAVGLMFVGVAAVVAQLVATGRAANGTAAALVGLAFVVRGVGDALGDPSTDLMRVESSWVSWFSPIGWAQRSRPFSDADPGPLLGLAAVALLLCGAALVLRSARDLGWSLVGERDGRATATRWGRTLPGLGWRLQRGALAGWCIGGVALGLIAGTLGPVVADVAADNTSLAELIGRLVPGAQQPGILDVFTAALLGIAGVLAAAAGVQAVLRLHTEEAEGRGELLLAASVSRTRWLLTTVLVACTSVLVVAAASGLAAGLAVAAGGGGVASVGELTVAALAHTPAALVFVAVAALALAVLPAATALLGWGLLTAGLVIGQLGDLLRLPDWLQAASPFSHSAAMPLEEFDPATAGILLAVTVALAGTATVLYRRRDLRA